MTVKFELDTHQVDQLVRAALLELSVTAQNLLVQIVDAEDLSYLQARLNTIKALIDSKPACSSQSEPT